MSKPSFTKKVIGMVNDDVPNAVFNALSVVGDINGDGFDDVVIGAVNGKLVWLKTRAKSANGKCTLSMIRLRILSAAVLWWI